MKTRLSMFFLIIWLFLSSPSGAQNPREQTEPKPARIQLNANSATAITLTTQAAPLPQVVDQLARQLHCALQISPALRAQNVTVELVEADLVTTLNALAPQFYVDELLAGGPAATRQLLAGYLLEENEQPPAAHASFGRHLESVALSGLTDPDSFDSTYPMVQVQNGLLTIHAPHQPLSEVLYAVAEQLGIPFVLHHNSTTSVALDLFNVSVEEFLLRLPDNVRLTRRLNFPAGTSTPLRLELLAPEDVAEP